MAKPKTCWAPGDPEPDRRTILHGVSERTWFGFADGWRRTDMDSALSWDQALALDGPMREIRMVGGRWVYADLIDGGSGG